MERGFETFPLPACPACNGKGCNGSLAQGTVSKGTDKGGHLNLIVRGLSRIIRKTLAREKPANPRPVKGTQQAPRWPGGHSKHPGGQTGCSLLGVAGAPIRERGSWSKIQRFPVGFGRYGAPSFGSAYCRDLASMSSETVFVNSVV